MSPLLSPAKVREFLAKPPTRSRGVLLKDRAIPSVVSHSKYKCKSDG